MSLRNQKHIKNTQRSSILIVYLLPSHQKDTKTKHFELLLLPNS
jgi:hypothetical protein